MPRSRTAIFLDRDGVVNRRIVGGYVRSWNEFDLLPDILTVLPAIHARGELAVLVTNQRGIALGLMSLGDLEDVHAAMQKTLLERCGHTFDAIEFCPHAHDAGCSCRKPEPGMLVRAAERLDIDLSRSWMLGDSESDVEAGAGAGCRTVLIAPDETVSAAEIVVPSLVEGWRRIVGS